MHWNVHAYRMLADERIASLRRDAARQQLERRVRGMERPRHVLVPWIERMRGVGILAWVLRSERTRAEAGATHAEDGGVGSADVSSGSA
jgi:hypothetical protein